MLLFALLEVRLIDHVHLSGLRRGHLLGLGRGGGCRVVASADERGES